MTVKKVLWWGFWLFVLFFVVRSPVSASETTRDMLCHLEYAANQVAMFATSLFS